MRGEVVVRRGKSRGKSYVIPPGGRLTLGRGEYADVQMFDEGLSRRHCVIENHGDSVVITDLDSRNGTYVNGERITTTVLHPGDMVALGLATVEFRAAAAEKRSRRARPSTTSLRLEDGGDEAAVKKMFDPSQTQLFRATNEDALRRAHRNLAAIYDVGNAINSETNLSKLFSTVVESVLKVTGGDRAAVLTISHETGQIDIAAALDRVSKGAPKEMQVSRTIANAVMETMTWL